MGVPSLGLVGYQLKRFGSRSFLSSNSSRSIYLDVIRAVAAQLVLWNHLRGFFFINYQAVQRPSAFVRAFYASTALGEAAVVVFFVLTGYLVGAGILRDIQRGTWSWRKYLVNRLTRLLIVLLPALLLGLVWDSMGLRSHPADNAYMGAIPTLLRHRVADALSWKALVGNLCFMQNLEVAGTTKHVLPTFGSNVPLWSLAYEFWYYITFPLLCLSFYKSYSPLKRGLHLLLGLGILWMVPNIREGFSIWLMGAALFFVPKVQSPHRLALKMGTSIAAVAAMVMLLFQQYGTARHRNEMLGATCAILIYLIGHYRGTTSAVDRLMKIPRFLAASSYTLYLSHFPLLVFVQAALLRGVRWQPTPTNLALLACIGAVAIAYSIALYFLFESRTERLRAMITPRVLR